jgi:hypothetical protein
MDDDPPLEGGFLVPAAVKKYQTNDMLPVFSSLKFEDLL